MGKKNWDLLNASGYLGLIASILAILSFIVNVALYYVDSDTTKITEWTLGTGYVSFAIALSAIVFREMRLRSRMERESDRNVADLALANERLKRIKFECDTIKNSVEDFHFVFHYARDAFMVLTRSEVIDSGVNELFRLTLQMSLDHLSRYFSNIFGIPCSVCVKLITDDKNYAETGDNNFELSTLVRDSRSAQAHRGTTGDHYLVHDNTGFRNIIVNGEHYFYNGNLPGLRTQGHYTNRSPNWMDHYKCVAVVPIKRDVKTSEGKIVPMYSGFLCLDANKEEAFPERLTIYSLACLADTLYTILCTYRRLMMGVGTET